MVQLTHYYVHHWAFFTTLERNVTAVLVIFFSSSKNIRDNECLLNTITTADIISIHFNSCPIVHHLTLCKTISRYNIAK